MIKKDAFFNFFLKVLVLVSCASKAERALVVIPVADLVGEPIAQRHSSPSVAPSYNTLPWSCYQSHYTINARLHQLLLHEQVTLIDTRGDEVCIEIPSAYCISRSSLAPHNRYWTHKKNIIPLSSFSKRDLKKIPPPLDFQTKLFPESRHIVSLKQPWHDTKRGITFSAGTRCMVARSRPSKKMVSIYFLNPHTLRIEQASVPRTCIHISFNKTKAQKREDFITLLRSWTQSPGTLAYVLGGCSYTQSHEKNIFDKKEKVMNNQIFSYYERPTHQAVKTGFDCSNLILRAAQIAGIPYFYKNTTTLCHALTPLSAGEHLTAGDLIWMPGHVIVVADTQKNSIIEAHSYDGGYGRVHEMPLNKMIKGMTSFTDLEQAYFQKKNLERLDSTGRIQKTYPLFKLLKLDAVWPT